MVLLPNLGIVTNDQKDLCERRQVVVAVSYLAFMKVLSDVITQGYGNRGIASVYIGHILQTWR